jgi:YhcH/YjgK/YiaL family protein
MIVTRLDEAGAYAAVHPLFAAALEWLRNADWERTEDGRHVIDGERLFVLVAGSEGRGRATARIEAHRRYIDLQYVIEGVEEIGIRPRVRCATVSEPYAAERDIEFFAEASESWLALPAGSLAVFFPEDGHAPTAGTGRVRKAVVKAAVDG